MEDEGDDKIPQGRKKEDEQRKEKEKEKEKGERGESEAGDDGDEDDTGGTGGADQSGAFYSILNVSSDATEEEIRAAYRRLSLVFHPDKHSSSSSSASPPEGGRPVRGEGSTGASDQHHGVQRAAVEQFQRITRAYEVLSDPTQRAIYDLYGEEGLKSKLQVGSVLTTPTEIKEEFERIQREKEEARLRAQLHPKGTVIAAFNATHLFDPYPRSSSSSSSAAASRRQKKRKEAARQSDSPDDIPEEADFFSRIGLAQVLDFAPELRQVSIQQSVETSLTKTDHFSATGFILTRNGMGASEVSGTYRHDLSNYSNAEATIALGSKPSLTLKAFSSSLPFGCFGSVSTKIRPEYGELRIGRSFLVGAPVSDDWVGYLTYNTGLDDAGMVVGFTRRNKKSSFRISGQMSDDSTLLNLQGSYDVLPDTKVKGNLVIGTPGIVVSVGTEKQMNDHSKLGFALEVGAPQGVTIKFRFIHVGQTFSFPILLAQEPMLSAVLVGSLVPLGLGLAANYFILDPIQKKKKLQRLEKLRRRNKKAMEEGRKSAQMAVKLMKETVERKREQEASKNGLIIVEAFYGNLEAEDARRNLDDSPVIDTTAPLQSLVHNSKLYLTNKSKSNLIGFCDPCVGEDKKLSVTSLFKNRLHFVIINDLDTLALPLKSHIVREE